MRTGGLPPYSLGAGVLVLSKIAGLVQKLELDELEGKCRVARMAIVMRYPPL